MAHKYGGYTKNEILTHIKSEHTRSLAFVKTKRDLFRERIKDYTNVTQDKDKIYVRLIFSVMQTLMALHYQDEMSVEFVGRQLGASEVADQLENLASFDYEEMDMEKLMFSVERDRLFFGTGILVYDHRDSTKLHPVYKRVNPLSRLPDPSGNSNFHQFELEINSAMITKENGYMNTNKVKELISTRNNETDQTVQKYTEVRELQHDTANNYTKGGFMIPVHYCYTTFGGDKRFVVTACDHGTVIKMQKIEAVFEEEKKDKQNIEFPVFTFQYSPLEYDPFGVSIPDLISDKQRGMQLLLNLERIKAENEARGDMFVVDTTKVNIKDLKKPSKGPKYIKAKGGDLKNYITEVPKSQIKGDVSYMKNALQQQSTLDIGLDERSLGITPDRNITATENQRVQKNANIRQMLNTRVKMRGIKAFWNDWYKRYYQNFNYKSEKNIIINSKLGSRPISVRKKDIITGYDINIKIISKAEQEAEREKQKVDFFATLNLILDDPQSSTISKTLAKRKAMRLSGMSSEEARLYVAPSLEEMQAQYDIELINKNELPELGEVGEDHMTYIVMYQRALPTPARFAITEARKQLYLKSGQQQEKQMANAEQQMQGGGMGGGAMAQLANGAMQQNEQVATALQ